MVQKVWKELRGWLLTGTLGSVVCVAPSNFAPVTCRSLVHGQRFHAVQAIARSQSTFRIEDCWLPQKVLHGQILSQGPQRFATVVLNSIWVHIRADGTQLRSCAWKQRTIMRVVHRFPWNYIDFKGGELNFSLKKSTAGNLSKTNLLLILARGMIAVWMCI